SSDLQQATIALQIATASTNSSLENSNKTLASASINGTSHLTVNENIVQTISQYPL
ncbi:hypothetical protein RZY64_001986, partial [Campylobacter jejuni]|nr:hypothetical protein [Campylobacter jejuni]